MRRILGVVVVAASVLVLSVAASTALAQDEPIYGEGQWYISPMLSGVFDDEDRLSDPGLGFSFGFGKHFLPHWNVELDLLGERLDGYNRVDQSGVGIDFIGMGETTARVVPYGVIGLDYLRTNVVEAPGGPRGRDDDNMATSFGVGIMTRFGSADAMFRAELRNRLEFAEPRNLNDVLLNVGVVFPLGEKRGIAPPDSDGDGVPDPSDRCPGTPPGAAVDAYGCELDSDHDGVVDRLDKCPGTPPGVSVDANGCPLDSDGDGVTDDQDKCPNTPHGTQVGADGCPLDSDGDGVLDADDQCPGTPRGVRVDYRGCEIKEEIELPGVNFELDSAKLTADSSTTLDGAVTTLKRYGELSVECAGHTDSTGSDAYNQRLSQQRAHSVCAYLTDHGIDPDRLTERGYGESRPIADNATEEGRARNRRVTLRITGGT
jgi:OmpA-OmpF porin, OOP family